MQVQLQLFSVFATDLATGTGCAAHLRHDVGVSRLMYMLKTFYWLHDAPELDHGKAVVYASPKLHRSHYLQTDQLINELTKYNYLIVTGQT